MDNTNADPNFHAMLFPFTLGGPLPRVDDWTDLPLSWCLQNLGEGPGRAYFDSYQRNAPQLRALFSELFSTIHEQRLSRSELDKLYRIEAVEYPGLSSPNLPTAQPTLLQKLLLASMKQPITLINLVLLRDNQELPLRGFAYLEGQWRFLGEPATLLLHVDEALLAQPNVTPKESTYDDSEDSLRAMIQAMAQAAKDKDYLSLRRLLQQSKLTAPEALFVEMFGARRGPEMASRYQALWSRALEHLLEVFYLVGESDEDDVVSTMMRREPAALLQSFEVSYLPLQQAKPLGVVDISGLRLLYWVYQDGAWRYALFMPALVHFEETSEGLSDFVSLLQILCHSELRAERQATIDELRTPDHWFTAHYHPKIAKRLQAEHQASVDEGALTEVTREISDRRQHTVEARGHILALDQENSGLQRELLLQQTSPAFLYSLSFSGGYALRSFIWVDGRWRWLGKMRAIGEFTAPAVRMMSAFSAYGDSAAELARFLGELTQYLYARATSSDEAEFQAELDELCRGLLLPKPKEWFAESFGGVIGEALGEDYTHRISEAPLKQLLASMIFGGFYKVSAKPLSESHAFTNQLITKHSQAALYSSLHQNPETSVTHGAWVYAQSSWRYAGSMQALTTLPEWRQALQYEQRFPKSQEGLQRLYGQLLSSISDDTVLFGYLLDLSKPKEVKPEWFAQLSEDPVKSASSYHEKWSEAVGELLRTVLKLSTIKDKYISSSKSERATAYGVFVHLPRQERVLGLAPVCFYEGAWRILGELFVAE